MGIFTLLLADGMQGKFVAQIVTTQFGQRWRSSVKPTVPVLVHHLVKL